MIVAEIKFYELLKAKLGEKEADAFVSIMETKIDKKFEEACKTLATREDLALTKEELTKQIGDTKADLIKWMFIFWIGQVAATFGFILLFLKK